MEDLKIPQLLVDDSGDDQSYFRILVNNRNVKYLSIDFGLYDPVDMVWDKMLVPQLPPLPTGDWNLGHITKSTDNPQPHFDWTAKKEFSSARPAWHPVTIDYLSLTLGAKLMPNVYEATSKQFEDRVVIAKFATFPFEASYYAQETAVYC